MVVMLAFAWLVPYLMDERNQVIRKLVEHLKAHKYAA
jgi:hypothetical protein